MAEHKSIYESLIAFQAECPAIPRSKTVKVGSYSYSYAPLDEVRDAINPLMKKFNIGYYQSQENGHMTTTIFNQGGETISSSVEMPPKAQDAQKAGSQITYMKRYGLALALGLITEEDDDGKASMPKAQPVKQETKFADPRRLTKEEVVNIVQQCEYKLASGVSPRTQKPWYAIDYVDAVGLNSRGWITKEAYEYIQDMNNIASAAKQLAA